MESFVLCIRPRTELDTSEIGRILREMAERVEAGLTGWNNRTTDDESIVSGYIDDVNRDEVGYWEATE